jgi:hypothetical protein
MTDEVMFEIRELTGQVYRDHYAGQEAADEHTGVARPASVADPTPATSSDRDLVGVR